MEYLIFLGIGLLIIIWGIRTKEEVTQLSTAIVGAIFLVWGFYENSEKSLPTDH